jgi:predicted kinase
MLIILAGLPAAGKTTLARAAAQVLRAVHLRIDTIEQALRSCGSLPNGVVTEGYVVAHGLARDNLRLGHTVIADMVNPLPVTRDAWVTVAEEERVQWAEIEVICSNTAEHHSRIRARSSDIAGLRLPDWDEVQRRNYAAWSRTRHVLDTAGYSVTESTQALLAILANVSA